MAPFTGGMAVLNTTLMSYGEICVLLLLFGFWPGVVVWLAVRRVKRRLAEREPVVPYVHTEVEKQPDPPPTFPGAERLKLAQVPRPENAASAQAR